MYKQAGRNFNGRRTQRLAPGSAAWLRNKRDERLKANEHKLLREKFAKIDAAVKRVNETQLPIDPTPRLVKRAALNLPPIERTKGTASADHPSRSLASLDQKDGTSLSPE